MKEKTVSPENKEIIKIFQENEITEYYVYSALAKRIGGENGKVLKKIAQDEQRHYQQWKEYSGEEVRPRRFKIFYYRIIARFLGITFAVKMMEKNEEKAEENYGRIEELFPETSAIIRDEKEHENLLLDMIDEERIKYIGSMVLGLNDALVELTGALAGFTLALQNTRIIGLAGLITGISAALSMGASEYLSQKSETENKDPLRASFYTGVAYIIAVVFLVLPFFILTNYYIALLLTLLTAIFIILLFSQFVSIVRDMPFIKFFREMVFISLGVAIISFIIGWLSRIIIPIQE
ncbi:MAG: rubrerythrin family protein [Calditrichaeota bacterium]|nr:VIT1/CCC1 transporter family protein [Calditrichota bacterium]RQW01370.1 MAG: rubrerythrin family protein [Calditrichota bacterium]